MQKNSPPPRVYCAQVCPPAGRVGKTDKKIRKYREKPAGKGLFFTEIRGADAFFQPKQRDFASAGA